MNKRISRSVGVSALILALGLSVSGCTTDAKNVNVADNETTAPITNESDKTSEGAAAKSVDNKTANSTESVTDLPKDKTADPKTDVSKPELKSGDNPIENPGINPGEKPPVMPEVRPDIKAETKPDEIKKDSKHDAVDVTKAANRFFKQVDADVNNSIARYAKSSKDATEASKPENVEKEFNKVYAKSLKQIDSKMKDVEVKTLIGSFALAHMFGDDIEIKANEKAVKIKGDTATISGDDAFKITENNNDRKSSPRTPAPDRNHLILKHNGEDWIITGYNDGTSSK
jgi:hypothetical protein